MAMLQHETILPMNFMQGLAGHHALKDSIERFDGTNIRFRFRSINNNDELQEQEKCHQRKLDWMIQVQ
jgi:hypothetical protein